MVSPPGRRGTTHFDPEAKTHNERHEEDLKERDSKLSALVSELKGNGQKYVVETAKLLLSTGKHMDEVGFDAAARVFRNINTIYTWGVMKRVVMFTVFLVLFSTNLISSYVTRAFVSLDINAGTCRYVPKSWTNPVLLLDRNGIWQGTPGFRQELAMYQISLYEFMATPATYREWMSRVADEIQSTGNVLAQNDLAHAILYWASWSYTATITHAGITSTTTVAMAAKPNAILNNEGLQGTIASVNSDCSLLASAQSYNSGGNGLFSSLFSASALLTQDTTSSCYNIVNPAVLGYDSTVNGDAFQMHLDATSIFTALAIANQVNGNSTYDNFITFKEVTRSVWPLFPGDLLFNSSSQHQQVYVVVDRFDPNYPGMTPITCVGPLNGPTKLFNCALRQGKSYGVPFLEHKGTSLAQLQPCDCTAANTGTCDSFNFMLGTTYFDHSTPRDHRGDGYTAWLAAHPDETSGGYPELFLPVVPLLEMFVEPVAISALQANTMAAPAAYSALFGQLCSSTRCIPCGPLYTTAIPYTMLTPSTISALSAADYAHINVGMQLVSYVVAGTTFTRTATSSSSAFVVMGAATAANAVISVSSIAGITVGSVITGATLSLTTTTRVTAVYGTFIEISPPASSTGSASLNVAPVPLKILIKAISDNNDNTYTVTFDTALTGLSTTLLGVSSMSFACPQKLTSTSANTVYNHTSTQQRALNFQFAKVNHYGVLHAADTEYLTVTGTTTSTGVDMTNLSDMKYYASSSSSVAVVLTAAQFASLLSTCTVAGGNLCNWVVSGDGIHALGDYSATYSAAFVVSASQTSVTLSRAPVLGATTVTFSFTKQEGGYGSLSVYNSFSALAQTVTMNNLQLANGACANSLVSPNITVAFDKPWGQLVEVYFQCTAALGDAILSSAGIAAGTAGLLVPTFFWAFMFLVMAYTAYNHAVSDMDKRMQRVNQLYADDFVANADYTVVTAAKHEQMKHLELYHYSIGQFYEKHEVSHLDSWQDSEGNVHEKESKSAPLVLAKKKTFTSRFFAKKSRMWKMHLTKVTAVDLLNKGTFGNAQDPACKLFLGAELFGQTRRIVDGGTEADWSESFQDVQISKHDYLEGIELRVEVFNEHLTGHETPLGVGSVVLNQAIPKEMLEQVCKIWIRLTTPNGVSKGVVCIDAYLDGELVDEGTRSLDQGS